MIVFWPIPKHIQQGRDLVVSLRLQLVEPSSEAEVSQMSQHEAPLLLPVRSLREEYPPSEEVPLPHPGQEQIRAAIELAAGEDFFGDGQIVDYDRGKVPEVDSEDFGAVEVAKAQGCPMEVPVVDRQ